MFAGALAVRLGLLVVVVDYIAERQQNAVELFMRFGFDNDASLGFRLVGAESHGGPLGLLLLGGALGGCAARAEVIAFTTPVTPIRPPAGKGS